MGIQLLQYIKYWALGICCNSYLQMYDSICLFFFFRGCHKLKIKSLLLDIYNQCIKYHNIKQVLS